MQQSYRQTNPALHYAILIFMVSIGVLTLGTHTVLHAMTGAEHTHKQAAVHVEEHCHESSTQSHTIVFRDDMVVPEKTVAARCDTIIVKNELSEVIEPAIGSHPKHLAYPGFEEKMLQPGQTYSFRVALTGEFELHDHEDYTRNASLIVR